MPIGLLGRSVLSSFMKAAAHDATADTEAPAVSLSSHSMSVVSRPCAETVSTKYCACDAPLRYGSMKWYAPRASPLDLIRGQFHVRYGSGELVPAPPRPWVARQMPKD